MALIPVHDSYTKTGVMAGVTIKAVKAGTIPHTGPDPGGSTLVDDADVATLPRPS